MPEKTDFDVLVIGAGLAGLTASQHLVQLGYHVCLLEARNRVGGRIYSQKLKNQSSDVQKQDNAEFQNSGVRQKESSTQLQIDTDESSFELGAFSVQGAGSLTDPNPLMNLLKDFNIKTTRLDPFNSDFFSAEGERISFEEWVRPLKKPLEAASQLIQATKTTNPLNKTHSVNKPSKASLATILNYGIQIPPQDSIEYKTRQLITATIQRNTGTTPDQVSLLEVMHDGTYSGGDEFILGGSYRLIEGLLQACMESGNFHLALKSPVQDLHYLDQDSKFKIRTETGEQYHAKVVLCAVPLGVLKKNYIQFTPALSKNRQRAIRHLNLGERNQVLLEFEKAFWPESVDYLYPNDPNLNVWHEYINLMPFLNGRPILQANMFGTSAGFAKKSDSEILEIVLAPLKRVYKANVSTPKILSISHWDIKRFTASAMPYCGLLSTEEDLIAIQEPEANGLYFAGDYTARGQKQTLNAAYDSGLKAAMEMDVRLKYKEREEKKKRKMTKH